jgi:hypothetical protein
MAKESGPLIIRALNASQGDFGHECQSSCAMVATVYCHCLLESALRNPDSIVRSLSVWTAIGCWLFKWSLKRLDQATSKNPTHTSPALYTNPVTISKTVPEIGASLEAKEEYSGVLYTPNTQDPTIEAEFGIDGAFISLEAVISKMAQTCEQRPVACTFITRENVHAISIRKAHPSQPLDCIEWSAAPEEALEIADILWTGQVYIDFVDSHRNSESTGMSDGRGKGVWIQFQSFSSLCAYLRQRYPPESEKNQGLRVAPTLYTRRKNSFEACIWQSKRGAPLPLFDLAQRLLERSKFVSWMKKGESTTKKRPREKPLKEPVRGSGLVPNTRQRLEMAMQRLDKNKDPAPG